MDKKALKKQLGANILKYRRANGYTQAQLAELLNVETSFIAHVEAGNRTLSTYNLYRTAIFLHVSCDALLCEETALTHLENIDILLKDKPLKYVAGIEKLVRVCVNEFEQK